MTTRQSTALNVIDDAADFASQHYHDFLNRQADSAGLNFWKKRPLPCGTNAQCLRLNASMSRRRSSFD
jgi:hypothetical protein